MPKFTEEDIARALLKQPEGKPNPFITLQNQLVENALRTGVFTPIPIEKPKPSLTTLRFDGTDLYTDKQRAAKNLPPHLVIDPESLAYADKGKLIRALKSMTLEGMTEQGLVLKLGYRYFKEGREFQIVKTKKGATGNGYDLYISSYAIFFLYMRRVKGIKSMCSNRLQESAERQKTLIGKLKTILLPIRIANQSVLPSFKVRQTQKKIDDAIINFFKNPGL